MSVTDGLVLPIGPLLLIPGPQTTRALLGDLAYRMDRGRDFRPNAPVWIKTPRGVQLLRPRGDIEAAELEDLALGVLEANGG